jgi:hypothetical protein
MAMEITSTAGAQVVPQFWGAVETYEQADPYHRGVRQYLTWGELHARISREFELVGSLHVWPTFTSLDETYLGVDERNSSWRVGRIRTAFGFSDWSDLWYSGVNHIPLVRTCPLVDSLKLNRQDSGIEGTTWVGPLQIQGAGIDTKLDNYQVTPSSLNFGSLRLQYSLGNAMLGIDYLSKLENTEKIYGFDTRLTVPHWILKAEAYHGDGSNSASGYYFDATYRIPSLTRTQLIACSEGVWMSSEDDPMLLQTFGIRQVFSKNFTLSVNYGWGSNLNYGEASDDDYLAGWNARGMFQVQF